MPNKIEEWGQKRPVTLTVVAAVAGVVLGALVSIYPADSVGYTRGRDAGDRATEEVWNAKFQKEVDDKVKEQLPIAYQKEFENFQSELAKRDAAATEQKTQIERLSIQLDDASKVANVLKLYENFARSADNIRNNLQNARDRNKDAIRRERESAFRLVEDIHSAHVKIEDWANLFNDQATKLATQIAQNPETVTDDQILAFLAAFSEDSANKKERARDLIGVAAKAQEIRD